MDGTTLYMTWKFLTFFLFLLTTLFMVHELVTPRLCDTLSSQRISLWPCPFLMLLMMKSPLNCPPNECPDHSPSLKQLLSLTATSAPHLLASLRKNPAQEN